MCAILGRPAAMEELRIQLRVAKRTIAGYALP